MGAGSISPQQGLLIVPFMISPDQVVCSDCIQVYKVKVYTKGKDGPD